MKDTFDIPLSALLSSFEVIRLENTDEALTAVDGRVYMSDNYLGICSLKRMHINFMTKKYQIACVTGSDVGAMHKRIERLAKKLQTPKDEDMITYLLGDLRVQMSINVDNR